MKGQTVRKFAIQMIAAAVAQCSIMAYQPLGIAFFAAAYAQGIWRYVLFPVMVASMALVMEPIQVMKYGIVMLVLAAVISLAEVFGKRRRETAAVSDLFLCLTGGLITAAMECSDFLFVLWDPRNFMIAGALGIFTAGMIYFMRCAVRQIMRPVPFAWVGNETMVSLAALAGILAYFISRQSYLPGFAAPAFMIAVVLYMAAGHGAGSGAIAGAICGIVLSLQTGSVEALGAMCLLGLLGGCFQKLGKPGVAAGGFAGLCIVCFMGARWMLGDVYLQAACAGAGLFLLIPGSFHSGRREGQEFLRQQKEQREESLYLFRNRSIEQAAESFRTLSYMFRQRDMHGEEDGASEMAEENVKAETAAVKASAVVNGSAAACENCHEMDAWLAEKQRMNRMWRARLRESREAVADQMAEVSNMMEDCCKRQEEVLPLSDEMEEKLWQVFRHKGMILKKIIALEQKNGRKKVLMRVNAAGNENIPVKTAAAICGECLNWKLCPDEDSPKYIAKEGSTIYLNEETCFRVLFGTAGRKKGREEVSGDNFGHVELPNGQMLFSLSDGAGSGQQANGESAALLELLEQFLESGLGCENALRLINSVMAMDAGGAQATADMGILDLYSGVCHFVKMGASVTFIRRDSWVEMIGCRNLPMGLLETSKMEQSVRKLYDGDFIIMMTDGLLESMKGDGKEQILSEYISSWKGNNPKELADSLLEFAGKNGADSEGRDDATVLVAAVWEK